MVLPEKVENTYAEAFDGLYCRLLITAERGLTKEDTNGPFIEFDPLRFAAYRATATPSTVVGRIEAGIPTVLIDACNSIAQNNVLILGSQSVQALALKVNLFEQIKDQVYLRLVNAGDRELIITQHQLKVQKSAKLPMFEKQVLGIREGEGLLFRGDTSLSTAFHFKTDSTMIPVDLHPVKVTEIKMRGSKTFGLVPTKFAQLMKILKILAAQPLSNDSILDELEINDSDERLLTQMSEFGLCEVK